MASYRYKAFISYSHHDREWAAWLQRALERYRVPKRLVGTETPRGPVPRRLSPVFRDRSDLSAASDLSGEVKRSLDASENLVVVCSPAAMASGWVNEEVRYFQSTGRGDRIVALVVDGEPEQGGDAGGCFPPALLQDAEGRPREPLAADVRKWADGKLLSRQKVIAGLLGIRLDDLRRRDMQRRQRLWLAALTSVSLVAAAMAVLALVAVQARKAAETRRQHAEELVGYMVGDLQTKLDEVGRLDILQGVGDRVSEYLQTLDAGEMTDRSLIQQARVWRQLGEVEMSQNDMPAALDSFSRSRDVLAELHRRNPEDASFVYELGNAEFWVGYVHLETGDFAQAERALNDYLAWSYRLNALEPGNAEWVMEKSYAHANLAALVIRRGSTAVDEALLHIGESVRFNREALELAPGEAGYLSELGETMAWQADTQLLNCDLRGALASRLENEALARAQLEASPGNFNLRRRHAYALSGLAMVQSRLGLLEDALGHFEGSAQGLDELLAMDRSNLDIRSARLARDVYLATGLAESGRLDEAIERLAAKEPEFEETLLASGATTLSGRLDWIDYQLAFSEMLHRAGQPQGAARHLGFASETLESLMDEGVSPAALSDQLEKARFLRWQQSGTDLFASEPFARAALALSAEGRSCSDRVTRVKRAILEGEEERARRLTSELLELGYRETGFIRLCRDYKLCDQGG